MAILNVNINHSDIIYAVRNKTHKIGKASGAKDQRVESNMQADDTAQDTRIVADAISRAIGNVVSELSKYVIGRNDSDETGITVVTFNTPSTWRDSNKNGMIDDINGYIVDYTVCEFLMSARDGEDARAYLKLANASLMNAKRKLYNKKSPI